MEDPQIAAAIQSELERQRNNIILIASENFASRAVMEAQGCIMTNKYAEGYPGKRYYRGTGCVDVAEELARERCKKLFGAEHVNVQPHSGTQANMAAYFAVLKLGDTIMGMNLAHGGHLSHGSPVNFSGKMYKIVPYSVSLETEMLDYSEMADIARKNKPQLIVVGASSYPRTIDFKVVREIADEVGAKVMADIAHIAGLCAVGAHPSPVPYSDIVTTTTHKTLRGPRGALIMCKEELAPAVDRAVFPGTHPRGPSARDARARGEDGEKARRARRVHLVRPRKGNCRRRGDRAAACRAGEPSAPTAGPSTGECRRS